MPAKAGIRIGPGPCIPAFDGMTWQGYCCPEENTAPGIAGINDYKPLK
jgi:hypothetical protein